jgi:hypothetical protein
MTVAELRKALEGVADDVIVVVFEPNDEGEIVPAVTAALNDDKPPRFFISY